MSVFRLQRRRGAPATVGVHAERRSSSSRAAKAAPPIDANADITASAANRNSLVDSSKLRVVIIEDSAIIRARLAETISEIPNVEIVGHAETETDALALLRTNAWDAAVLDLQLKQGTGLGVLKALDRSERKTPSRIIVFTNYAFPQYRDRSLSLGADYFFDKAREFHRVREVLVELASGGTSVTH